MRISQSVKAAVAQKASLPFELKVLEALLAGGRCGLRGSMEAPTLVRAQLAVEGNSCGRESSSMPPVRARWACTGDAQNAGVTDGRGSI